MKKPMRPTTLEGTLVSLALRGSDQEFSPENHASVKWLPISLITSISRAFLELPSSKLSTTHSSLLLLPTLKSVLPTTTAGCSSCSSLLSPMTLRWARKRRLQELPNLQHQPAVPLPKSCLWLLWVSLTPKRNESKLSSQKSKRYSSSSTDHYSSSSRASATWRTMAPRRSIRTRCTRLQYLIWESSTWIAIRITYCYVRQSTRRDVERYSSSLLTMDSLFLTILRSALLTSLGSLGTKLKSHFLRELKNT